MTTLRSETRATLAWCLKQTEEFTQKECAEYFKVHQVTISKQFKRLMELDVLTKEHLVSRTHIYYIKDREKAEMLVNERPKPRNGYIPVSQRRAIKKPVSVNFVFQLGAV